MDMHRPLSYRSADPQAGRLCDFCKRLDPQFGKRHALDQMVRVKSNEVASAHLTEAGHVAHKLLELGMKMHALKLREGRKSRLPEPGVLRAAS